MATYADDQGNRFAYIYAIIGPDQAVYYVGKSCHPHERFQTHLAGQTNRHLARVLDGLDKDQIGLQILEKVPISDWPEREQYWIAKLFEEGEPLTNIAAGGEGRNIGWSPSELSRRRMSQSQLVAWQDHRIRGERIRGMKRYYRENAEEVSQQASQKSRAYWNSDIAQERQSDPQYQEWVSERIKNGLSHLTDEQKEELRQQNSQSTLELWHTEEYRAKQESVNDTRCRKIAEALTGRTFSEETKQKMREARLGKKLSEETRQKISEALTGREFSQEHCDNISKAKKGKPGRKQSAETRKKIADARRGVALSEKTKKKISKAQKEVWDSYTPEQREARIKKLQDAMKGT